jgi:hypothetical protein
MNLQLSNQSMIRALTLISDTYKLRLEFDPERVLSFYRTSQVEVLDIRRYEYLIAKNRL